MAEFNHKPPEHPPLAFVMFLVLMSIIALCVSMASLRTKPAYADDIGSGLFLQATCTTDYDCERGQ